MPRGGAVLAGVGDLEGDDRVAAGDLGERRDPVARAAEVRDDDDDAGGGADGTDEPERPSRRGLAAALFGWFGRDRPEESEHPAVAARRRADRLAAGTERHDTEPVSAACREPADDERCALGHVRLAAVRRPEVHRRGVVEQQPRRQLAVGHVLADLRDQRSGGGVPVDAADVVARLVRPDPVELEALAVAATEVVAAHLATDPTVEGQLELADQAIGDGAWAGSGRGPATPADAGEVRGRSCRGEGRRSRAGLGHAVGSIAISRRGAGTRVSTRWTMVSAMIPSARAA
jgi:hypothetical protein